MSYKTMLKKIFGHGSDNGDSPQVIDGRIVTEIATDIEPQPHHESEPQTPPPPIPPPQIELSGLPPNHFPLTVPIYPQMFFSGAEPDFFMFLNWLEMKNRKPQTVRAYADGLQKWRSDLSNHFGNQDVDIFSNDFESALRIILKQNAGTPGIKLFKAMSAYAKYRLDYGDPRLQCILACGEIQTTSAAGKQKRSQLSDIKLTPQRIKMINAMAKELCVEGDRSGVWLGLTLRGVPVSAIAGIEFITPQRIRFKKWKELKETTLPDWLSNAMRDIAETKWRLSRVNIKKKIERYEHPIVLIKNNDVIMSVLRI